jgi:hypothetical protein
VTEQSGETRVVAPVALPIGGSLFWRVRAKVSSVFGEWSSVGAFHTPTEAIDLGQATILNSPGIHVDHTKRDGPDSWPTFRSSPKGKISSRPCGWS